MNALRLTSYVNDRGRIVATVAMRGPSDLALTYKALLPVAYLRIKELVAPGTPAMKSRVKMMRQQ
jgi:hypothetical protein